MADTYSFDVVSDFDRQELVNTIDQLRRDVSQRYDLKDSNTEIELEETAIVITTASDMTLTAVVDVLRQKATKRNLSLKIFDEQTPVTVAFLRPGTERRPPLRPLAAEWWRRPALTKVVR